MSKISESMDAGVSVFMITYNAAAKLEAALKAVSWAREIIVVDSFSTDETAALCARFGARFVQRPFRDYADQKNYALSLVTTPWALSVDSDEVVTEALRDEILKVVSGTTTESAYRIPRQSFIFGKMFRASGTQDDAPVRLLRTGRALFEQPIHEVVRVQGGTGRLSGVLLHYTYDSISDYLERLNRYTSREAAFLKARNAPAGMMDYALRPPLVFLRLFFLKRGYLDGMEGFFFCFFSAFYALVKYAKYREILRAERAA